MPRRVQLRRVKGWRKPPHAIVVARPTKWGNPCRWTDYPDSWVSEDGEHFSISVAQRRRTAVVDFEAVVRYGAGSWFPGYPNVEEIRRELAGYDLACWCPLDQPCHADVLLALANRRPGVGD